MTESEPASPPSAGDLPDEAEHVVVVGRSLTAPAPEEHPADRLRYVAGDELPFEVGAQALPKHPMTLAALDAEGDVVAGGEDRQRRPMVAGSDLPIEDHGARLNRALKRWRSGEGFDPSADPDDVNNERPHS